MIKRILKRVEIWFRCGLFGHDWTSRSQKGIGPTKEQLDNGVEGFFDYASMYCDRCGKVSDLSISTKKRYTDLKAEKQRQSDVISI